MPRLRSPFHSAGRHRVDAWVAAVRLDALIVRRFVDYLLGALILAACLIVLMPANGTRAARASAGELAGPCDTVHLSFRSCSVDVSGVDDRR